MLTLGLLLTPPHLQMQEASPQVSPEAGSHGQEGAVVSLWLAS